MSNISDGLTKKLHRYGLHFYSVPIKRFTKEVYWIDGEGHAGSQEKFKTYKRMKCKHCNKRKNKYESTTVRSYE